jgi:hypothetical protein
VLSNRAWFPRQQADEHMPRGIDKAGLAADDIDLFVVIEQV